MKLGANRSPGRKGVGGRSRGQLLVDGHNSLLNSKTKLKERNSEGEEGRGGPDQRFCSFEKGSRRIAASHALLAERARLLGMRPKGGRKRKEGTQKSKNDAPARAFRLEGGVSKNRGVSAKGTETKNIGTSELSG